MGDPSAGVEYGGIPNRGAMMREIDAMMAPQSGFSAYNNPPASAGINPYGMAQEPQNYGPPGQMGHSIYDPYGSGGHLEGVPTVPDYYGVPGQMAHSVYEPEPVPGPGPGYYGQTPMSGSNHWIPENPMAPASTYGQLPGAGPTIYGAPNTASGDVLDPLGVGAGPSNQFSPLNAAIADVLDPVGVGAGPSDMYGPGANFGGPGSGADGYGAGPGIYGQTPSQGEGTIPPGMVENTPSEYLPGDGYYGPRPNSGDYQDLTSGPEDMGPLGQSATDFDVAEYHTQRVKRADALAERRIAEHEARFGKMKEEEKERQKEYLADLEKIQKKQRMFMVLGALSGDPNMARIAGTIAQQDMAVLDKKYEWASGDRTAQMQQALMYNADGEYDPPESMEELMGALNTMGADKTEMDWFAGQFFDDTSAREDNTYRNFIHTGTGEKYSGYGPPDESGDWAITGQYDYGTKDGKPPGGVEMQQYQIWEHKRGQYERGEITAEQLERFEKAMGFDDPATIKVNQEFAMFEDLYKGAYNTWTGIKDKDGEDIKGQPTGKQVWEHFQRWRKEALDRQDEVGKPDSTEGSKSNPIKVTSEEEFRKVKSGQFFVDSTGTVKEKK